MADNNIQLKNYIDNQIEIISNSFNTLDKKLDSILPSISQYIICFMKTGYQMVNGTCAAMECSVYGQVIINGICECKNKFEIVSGNQCVCPQYSTLVDTTCVCPINSVLTNGICICNIIGQIIQSNVCSCISGIESDGKCQQNVVVVSDGTLECNSTVYIDSFNIQEITHKIEYSNFSNGNIFSTEQIQNAFIDISDNVYSTITPLFQTQIIFNNIKIQIGIQSVKSGSILSTNSVITINQMNVISGSGCQITVGALFQLNIIQASTTTGDIKNLLVNLNFSSQSIGNITLIGNISGIMNISGYQILGQYYSTQTLAMISRYINQTTFIINYVTISPSVYNAGNQSSFLFSVVSISSVQLNNVAMIIGSSSKPLTTVSITTNAYDTNYFQFGGLIANIQSKSIIQVVNLVQDSYQYFSTNYICYSGFIIGYNSDTTSSVSIVDVCLQQKLTSTSQQLRYSGLIGLNAGNTSLNKLSIVFQVQINHLNCFGIVGYQHNSLNSEIQNMITKVNTTVGSSSFGFTGVVVGYHRSKNSSIMNVSVISSNISSSTYVGGVLGYCISSSIVLKSLKLSQIILFASSSCGVVVGYSSTDGGGNTFSISDSSSSLNYINGNLQKSCSSLTDVLIQSGC
ncbi:Hypothetical_protein [Hexamita inflata]|uniref:Hypothetical_protein n=1 Tax=Hexamita inflata TaxID=28002 RepID=A0AA86RDW1_9EUKA|nr:Hypothetical protein HINF_LOCUS63816 [Hexamita inflata]